MKHLADCHVHLGYGNFRKEQRSDKYQGTDLDHAYNNLLQYKDAGVTFLRDGGDRNLKAFRLREDAAKLGITLKSPGRALVRQGCYGKNLGEAVATIDDLKRELEFLLASGVDLFKVVQSDLVEVNGATQNEVPYFSEAMLALIVETAHQNGLTVMVHVNFPGPIATVIDAGADTIEHGYFMTEDLLWAMKKKGIAWTPTLAPFDNALTYDVWIPGWKRELVANVVQNHKAMVKKAAEIGVTILAGSDGGTSICPHGRCSLDEHRILKELIGPKFNLTLPT